MAQPDEPTERVLRAVLLNRCDAATRQALLQGERHRTVLDAAPAGGLGCLEAALDLAESAAARAVPVTAPAILDVVLAP